MAASWENACLVMGLVKNPHRIKNIDIECLSKHVFVKKVKTFDPQALIPPSHLVAGERLDAPIQQPLSCREPQQ